MKTIGVIFGGVSPEHEVSIISGLSVVKNINPERYNIRQIYIDKKGNWYEHKAQLEVKNIKEAEEKIKENLYQIENIMEMLKEIDIIFPVLHGKNGEDGTIQGLFELSGKKYVGSKVLASSIGMDKIYSKIIFEKAQIPQVNYIYIRENNGKYIYVDKEFNEKVYTLYEIVNKITEKLKFPIFVKPSNSGSSIGINKAHNEEELKKYIREAAIYDKKILLEQGIKGRELECAVLGNEDVRASGVGEIIPTEEFYNYEAKYQKQTKTVVNAQIPEKVKEQIRTYAIKAFKAISGKGLARVDFFWDSKNNLVYINEINTLPGFTPISMYAKLWEAAGLSYSKLIDKLIELAYEV